MTAAAYFDGHSARLHRVEVAAAGGTVIVTGPGIARVYPAGQARLSEPFDAAPAVVYFDDGARCEVAAEDGKLLAGALGYCASRVVRWQAHWQAALAALVLLVALLGAGVLWGVPAVAELVAQRLPASADASLGRSVLAGLTRQGLVAPTRFSVERLVELNQVLDKVRPQHPRIPIRLLVFNSERLGPNALALPDGTIVLTDQMVRVILGEGGTFGDAEVAQLAGVLAHEIGHIERRHGTRVLARTSLTAALSAALFGDFSAVAAGVPALLMNMSYSREMEDDADRYAIAALQERRIPLNPLGDLLLALDASPRARMMRDLPQWLSRGIDYTASHPAATERVAQLRAAAEAQRRALTSSRP
jgi:Zn-dependent protease with chaperone function